MIATYKRNNKLNLFSVDVYTIAMNDYIRPSVNAESIKELMEETVRGDLDIPEFQRDFVWKKSQVKDLFDSLINAYPIGSILVWNFSDYSTGKHVDEGTPKAWIVDGQQRLVSFCILSRKKPYWMDIDRWNDFVAKFKIRIHILSREIKLESPAIKNDPEWIYPHEILFLKDVREAAEELSKKISKPDLSFYIYDNMKRIQEAFDSNVPVVKISTSLESIATIFARINSEGTRVKLADVTLAYIAAYNQGWIKDKFIPYLDDLDKEGFDLDPTLLIRALTAVGENKAVLKEVSRDFLHNKDSTLDQAFAQLKSSTNALIQEFREIGLLSSSLIYAKNTLIPLIYLRSRFQQDFNFNEALHFFLLALSQGRYSGASETALQEDVNKIYKSVTFNDAVSNLHTSVNSLESEGIIVKEAVYYQADGRFLKLVLYLIAFKNQARDWFSKGKVRLGYRPDDKVNQDFTIEEHHFFPKSLLTGVGIEKEESDLLANITFINPGTNKRLKKEPRVYIKDYQISTSELEKQLVPVGADNLFELKNYRDFIDVRSSMISESIKNYLEDLYPEFYHLQSA